MVGLFQLSDCLPFCRVQMLHCMTLWAPHWDDGTTFSLMVSSSSQHDRGQKNCAHGQISWHCGLSFCRSKRPPLGRTNIWAHALDQFQEYPWTLGPHSHGFKLDKGTKALALNMVMSNCLGISPEVYLWTPISTRQNPLVSSLCLGWQSLLNWILMTSS